MTPDTTSAFDAHAEHYDALRRSLIPPFDTFYGTVVEALALGGRAPRRILDLGAGTGLLSGLVQRAYPAAQLVLLDGAPAMLDRARGALGDGARFCVGDLRDPLPEGRFDAVVSALAIHHLSDAGKRDLFARIHHALEPGGVFVNAEQVAGPSDELERSYRQWHRQASARLGLSDEEWGAAEQRMALDCCASVEAQLAWLNDAGFAEVDCLFKHYRFAVLLARRALSGG